MSTETPLTVDFSEAAAISHVLPRLPILSSHQWGWKNIHLNYFQRMPAWEVPEFVSDQQTLSLFSPESSAATEIVLEGNCYSLPKFEQNRIFLAPRNLLMSSRWVGEIEFTTCHLDAHFINQLAHESVNPDRVELIPVLRSDPLIWQIVMALQQVLETAPDNSNFYAESLATALGAHLLKFYATREPVFREYRGGLPQHKLKYAIEYINAHLSEDVSLSAISTELGISPYYLCRLFKQSIGMTPHAYLIQQRVERSKQLLKQKEGRILDIAIACGFANPSHFARCFRRQVGVSPKQFQIM
jgi:AraC family transcriptional regulator